MIKKLLSNKIICVSLIFLTGFIIYFWFDIGNNLVAIGGDSMIPLNPISNLKYLNSWVDVNNGSVVLSSIHFIFLLYALLQKIGFSLSLSQFSHVFMIHVIAALGMYYLSHTVFVSHPQKKLISLLSALLYMFTPSIYNMYFAYTPYAIAPLILGLFISGLTSKHRHIHALLIALCFGIGGLPDPHPRPFILLYSLIFFYSVFNLILFKKKKSMIIFLFIVSAYIFLINSWFFLRYMGDLITPGYISSTTQSVPISYNEKFLDEGSATINKMYRLYHDGLNMPSDKTAEYLGNLVISLTIYLYPFLVFCSIFFLRKKNKRLVKHMLFFLLITLAYIFWAKGPNPPLGEIHKWLLVNFSIYRVFRTTAYIILIPALTYAILIPFTISEMSLLFKGKKIRILIYLLFLLLIFINSYPLFFGYPTLNSGLLAVQDTTKHGIKIPVDFYLLNDKLRLDKSDMKVVSFPLSPGYDLYKWGYFGIPISSYILDKPLVYSRNITYGNKSNGLQNIIYSLIETKSDIAKKITGLSNIKYIIVNNEISGNEYLGLNRKVSNIFKPIQDYKTLFLYKLENNYILSHFYTPQSIIVSDQLVGSLPNLVSQPDYKIRTAIYFENQNGKKTESLHIKELTGLEGKTPVLEFKKINPTKYRIVIHKAKETFPLVFSESFHEGWRGYLVKSQINSNNQLKDYKIFDGNAQDQASKEELSDFIQKGWVATLGDGKLKEVKHMKYVDRKEILDYTEKFKIDFISKNTQDTIQNDNLPSGPIYETWFKKPLDAKNHLIVNGYANSWIINPSEICKDKEICKKNGDGSYDLELVVEFWPQRLFYIGLIISVMTLLTSTGYSFYFRLMARKNKSKIYFITKILN